MRVAHPIVALVVATAALTACDRHNANTAYNNSGASAAKSAAAESPATTTTATTTSTTTSSATSDTASPSVAATTGSPAGTPGGASSVAGETVTSSRILAAIAADSGLKDADINVTTSNGVVTLGGTAKSRDQVALATGIAQRQEGVARVESNIQVN